MNVYIKKAAKISGAACAATGIVALSALVASGAAVGAIVEGLKSAKDTMQKMLTDQEQDNAAIEEATSEESSAAETEATEADPKDSSN